MKGDFSRSTFDPGKHYTSVRMQQGRVQLDADWNEQADILLHLIATQLKDVVGPGGTAATEPGFAISLVEPAGQSPDEDQVDLTDEDQAGQTDEPMPPARSLPDFQIGAGRYYVDGVLCENEAPVLFSEQPDYPDAASRLGESLDADHVLVYLDVWGRHITAAEDPAMREIALGGPDTTTRVKTVWQVKLLPLAGDPADDQSWREQGGFRSLADWKAFVAQAADKGRLRAKWEKDKGALLENHLYRVEIHTVADDQVTFKWSRENGSVVFPIKDEKLSTSDLMIELNLAGLERDPYQLREDDRVEIVDDVTVLKGSCLPLGKVEELDRHNGKVSISADEDIIAEIGDRELRHPLLRRWENEAKPITPEADTTAVQGETWLDLENGIQVAFGDTGSYQAGDYWLIPARTHLAEGIEWPRVHDQPAAQPPHGTTHHYAPLALLQFQAGGWRVEPDAATTFRSLPQITADAIASDEQLQSTASDLEQVQANVVTLLEQMSRVLDYMALERTRLFHDFESRDELEEGDVVASDPDGEDHVKLVSQDNPRLVVGVVTEPIADQASRYRVALYGRVRCKVVGRVEPGDLLVPSPVPGHARKAGLYLQPGTMLGKALGSTESEQPDMVDMLVTLG